MNEQKDDVPMTDYDKKVVAHLNKIIELDKAGKLEWFTHEQVFSEGRRIIEAARARERANRIKAYQSQPITANVVL